MQKEETEAEEKEPLLLPEPEDPFRLPSLDDEDEEDVFEDFEPEPVQIPEKVREAMRKRCREQHLDGQVHRQYLAM